MALHVRGVLLPDDEVRDLWLVGDRIGLHPVAVIFAIMAGGQLFGFTGVLLALPAAAVLKVWLRHLREFYFGGAAANRPVRKRRALRRPPP